MFEHFLNLLDLLNPFSENFFLKTLFDLLSDFFKTLFSYLNPYSEKFFLKVAFVIDLDNLNIDKLNQTLSNKFAFYNDIKSLINDFISAFDKEESCPEFNITLPAFLGGATLNALDLSFYNNYRTIINSFIIGSCYFFYFRKLYYKIPNLVKGE